LDGFIYLTSPSASCCKADKGKTERLLVAPSAEAGSRNSDRLTSNGWAVRQPQLQRQPAIRTGPTVRLKEITEEAILSHVSEHGSVVNAKLFEVNGKR
ncbi:hypothetical protein U9M48_001326, partial [Paspalum notatum var. saurae]